MTNRIFIVHRWGGNPLADWYPWLKAELEKKGFAVFVPEMPRPEHPRIKEWVQALVNAVGKLDSETYFVGHSVGCQAILRYFETLPDAKIGGAVFVAGWTTLSRTVTESEEGETAKPWLTVAFKRPVHLKDRMIAIFSDNDPYVPLEENKADFSRFCSKIIVEKGMGHYDEDAKVPSALKALLELA